MNLGEYEKHGVGLYRDYADVVATILDAAIRAEGKKYRYQHIQRRAKEPTSLRKKLSGKKKVTSENIEDDVKDLAGCRVIFYSNGDVTAFVTSGILRANFEIDGPRSKPHHPVPGITDPSDQYKGYNIVVSLNADRASLPEYRRFAGLYCEVQIQTILDHAWSDTAHDITYKCLDISDVGAEVLKSIDARLQKIMSRYIDPAGHQFQKVLSDYDKVLKAKELHDGRAVERLCSCTDNNERHDLLEAIDEFLIPNLNDQSKAYPPIRDAIVRSIALARLTPLQERNLSGMKWDGVPFEDYAKVAADTVAKYAYLDVGGALKSACQLYTAATTEREREAYIAIAKKLAHHNIGAWKQVGPQIQLYLVSEIQAMQVEQIATLLPLIAAVMEEVLSADADDTSGKYNSITISMGAVPASSHLTKLRKDALGILYSLYERERGAHRRRLLRQAMSAATRPASHGGTTDELLATILDDCSDLVAFYQHIAAREQHDLLLWIEHDVLWIKRHNQEFKKEKPQLSAQVDKLLGVIGSFRKVANGDPAFVMFKTVLGYDAVFPPMWDNDDLNTYDLAKERMETVNSYVDQIADDTAPEWFERVRGWCEVFLHDRSIGGCLPYLLDRLGSHKPDTAIAWLKRDDPAIAGVASAILCGLAKGNLQSEGAVLATAWAEAGKNIETLAEYLNCREPLQSELLVLTVKAAIAQAHECAVLRCLEAVFDSKEENLDDLEKQAVQPAITFLSSIGKATWINVAWMTRRKAHVLSSFSEETVDLLLENLILCPKIDYRAEGVLKPLAIRFPEKVIGLFAERITKAGADQFGDDYESVPYELKEVSKPLQTAAKLLLEAAKILFSQDVYAIRTRAVRLVANVFPDGLSALHGDLVNLARERQGAEFVLAILRDYEGELFLHELCKELVEVLPEGDELLAEVRVILWSTGMLHGEFGQVESLRKKTEEMTTWLSDSRPKVRTFAAEVIEGYVKEMAVEQRRAEQDLEMRKLDWGNDDDDV